MTRSSWLDAAGVIGVPEVLWEDGERRFHRIWRRSAGGTRQRCLAVIPTAEHPTPGSVNRLAHEHGLKDHLDGAWALRPLELVRERGATVLVLEYHDGAPLDRLIAPPLEVGAFLRIAVALAAALIRLHERGLVHKDIKPANVLVDPSCDRVWLTGFGVASRLPREHQSPEPPEFIAGTLSHMAPEQTGRMNRAIDSRSDLYALGVTLYQALTGSLPFTATDPLEWVHCHVARRPVPPSARVQDVPSQVSAIVMKLLAKTPEERYQTAAGVERDLRRCLADWEGRRAIGEFPLGERDYSDRLLIPEKLYGREREVEALLASFDAVVASGTPRLVLVSGPPGIGKSSVVNELHKALVPPRGLFASGKFDQLQRDIPYATLAQAFQGLIRRLLIKPEPELRQWRDTLRQALDPNGALVVDLIPELKFIIGEQPAAPDVPAHATKARFQMALRRLVGVFARPEHPLALFLDDLQWLDAASLDLLEDLLVQPELQHLLLVGAYRDNEVDAAHPLMGKLAAIRRTGAQVQELALAALKAEDLAQLIADALHCEPQPAMRLAQLVHDKTAGNPFFANQFIQELVDEALITFDPGHLGWRWDLDPIHAKRYTDNVVELLVSRLSRLSPATQESLKALACLGSMGAASTLALVHGKPEQELHEGLWEALRLELIVRSEDSYRFVHDRVQEAAYSLIPDDLRAPEHLRIGRLLNSQLAPDKREEAVFEIVGHFNRASALVTSADEREELAALNLMAGKRAMTAGAYASALNCLMAAAALLPEDGWERRHDLLFELELHRATCEFMTGRVTPAQERLVALSHRATNAVERGSVACLLADVHFRRQRPDLGLEACLECLSHAGLDFPKAPTEGQARAAYENILSKVEGRSIDELVNLPMMTDRAARATMDVLTKVIPCAASTDQNLLSLIVCAAVDLSLTHGHCDSSCFAYQFFGFVAGGLFGNLAVGFRLGRVGREVVEQKGLRGFDALVRIFFAGQAPWARHGGTSGPLLRSALDIAMRTGDPLAAAASSAHLVWHALVAGEPLVEAEKEAAAAVVLHGKLGLGTLLDSLAMQQAYIRNLRGLTRQFGSLDDEHFDERGWASPESTQPPLPTLACRYWVRRLQARFMAGDYAAALDASIRAQDLLWATPTLVVRAECEFYGALARAAAWDSQPAAERLPHLQALAAYGRRLEACARECAENFQDRAALVNAELARIEGRDPDATRLYEEAIRSAQQNGFVHNEALALELAARFYAIRGFDRIAKAYLRDARSCYLQWGADGKVRQLDELHPHLRTEDRRPDSTRTLETPVEQLELAAVLEVLQAVSGETDLEKLIATVMRLGLEHAGADRGLLILPRGDAYRIEAAAGIGDDGVTVALHQTAVTAADLPESVFQYVLRTRETVLLHDGPAGSAFSDDDYLRRHRARSVLCLPLLEQSRIVGVLYLENRLTSGVFTPARMAPLKLLASLAAISIENARLYRDLQEREARVRRLIDANIIGIFIWHADGRVFDANEELLRIIGYSREDVVSGRLHWTDFSVTEVSALNARQLEELRQGGGHKAEERVYLRKNGTRVPVLTGGTIFEGARDEGVAFVIDLTERKRAEQALREQEHESRVILDTIPGLVAVLTPIGDLEAVNHEMVTFCGQPLEAMKHWGTNGTVHPDDMPQIGPIFAEAIATGKPVDNEARIRRFDGVYRRVQVRGLPLRDSSGRILRWYVLLADIEDRKRAEDALDQTREELARVARVMTLSALTASIAHEVSQPLAGIITNASTCLRMLDASPPNIDGARETARRTIRDGNRASDVITRLRAMFSKRDFTLEAMDLNEATREVVALSPNDLQRHRVILQLELAEHLPLIMGDRIQLQQVILNLLRNASEAMADVDDRPRQLVVRTETESDAHVRVTVRDAGVGLDPQGLNNLFDPFYTTKEGGMGIGLSVSRSIIERHQGRLWAEPNEGPGATFAFSLPAIAPSRP